MKSYRKEGLRKRIIGFSCVIQKCPLDHDLCTELDIVFLFLNSEIRAYRQALNLTWYRAGRRITKSAFESFNRKAIQLCTKRVRFTKAIIGRVKGRLRIDSSQSSGLSHSSNPEHQSGCSHIHFISLGDVEHLRKTFPHNSSQTIRDFFFAPE